MQDRVYRAGVFLVVDAVVENQSARPLDGTDVSVEFYDFFDGLLRAEHTVLRPLSLGPGQRATLRVVTPWSEAVRTLRYRFTWRADGGLRRAVARRQVWGIGEPTRDAER